MSDIEKLVHRKNEGKMVFQRPGDALSDGRKNTDKEAIEYRGKPAQAEFDTHNDLIKMPRTITMPTKASDKTIIREGREEKKASQEGREEKKPRTESNIVIQEEQGGAQVLEEGQKRGEGQDHENAQVGITVPSIAQTTASHLVRQKQEETKPKPDSAPAEGDEKASALASKHRPIDSDEFNTVVSQGEAILNVLWNTNLTGRVPQTAQGNRISSPASVLSPLARRSGSFPGYLMPLCAGPLSAPVPKKKRKLARRVTGPPEVIDLSNSDDISVDSDWKRDFSAEAARNETPRRVSNASLPDMTGPGLRESKRARVASAQSPAPIHYERDTTLCVFDWDMEDADAILEILNQPDEAEDSPQPLAVGDGYEDEPNAFDAPPPVIECAVLNEQEASGLPRLDQCGFVNELVAGNGPSQGGEEAGFPHTRPLDSEHAMGMTDNEVKVMCGLCAGE